MKFARVGAFAGTLAATAAASVLFAAPASAHTPHLEPSCKDGQATLDVNLKDYQVKEGKTNHVVVKVNGETRTDRDFDRNFSQKYSAPADKDKVTFVVDIKAWDDVNGEKRYTRTEVREVDPCPAKQQQPPAQQPPVEQPPVEQPPVDESSSAAPAPTTTVAPTTSSAAVVPIAAEETPLANTGASIAIPLVIGLVLLGGGAALLIVQRKRAARN
ncbi:LPXTG cell wall anchor domain-containing protein [Saccharothrix syringae]|uniref:LPXTG cell wall anchor domain-containing protein n=1 Tax=Saccharothrix syringae TaxID=103733 RepID=A0A5Q0H926_SACSY|nr:LPXTG cell wall anchor domain-containing protein [Saccharothrix syringae]QFZ22172.1 LPXTG cell wall anchor domain-containing protein [Saccharothrix syringae]